MLRSNPVPVAGRNLAVANRQDAGAMNLIFLQMFSQRLNQLTTAVYAKNVLEA
jgi:hypothetical protein